MRHVHDPELAEHDGQPQGNQRQGADLPGKIEDKNK
jgi:hypothetical protein